ncbi:MAG: hypothetical protein FWC61_04375 [Proteobacteria bacterium]|nr:hypothetical protein [Pseudomonadota bacterium]
MTRQIQIRRGTTAEHASFTGAIGEITMDTDAKTLRVHDGATPGGTRLARMSDVGAGGGGFDPATLAKVATSGSYNDLTGKPTIPAAYNLPAATATALGGVKVGSGVTVAPDGTISVAAAAGGPSDMADYVVASATGLSGTDYTSGWYRKYKSGWCEQGGITAATAAPIITFPIPMKDANYHTNATALDANNNNAVSTKISDKTALSCRYHSIAGAAGWANASKCWGVKGIAA